jgi:hypothetical protein
MNVIPYQKKRYTSKRRNFLYLAVSQKEDRQVSPKLEKFKG